MRIAKHTLHAAIVCALAAGTGTVSTALAQDGSPLEEIVVTAERRAESLQDVGLSVSAFDSEGLASRGITDVSRLELVVPGVNFAFAGNDVKFNVRGANSTNTFRDNASVVGAYVDGVYKPRASQQARSFFDVERVEFLKGPQGTLYGRNTFAGALNLYTAAPDLESTTASLDLGYGEFSALRVEGHYNMPISDNFAIRFAGLYENSDGYVENNAGPNMGQLDDLGLRVSALWEVSDTFDATLRITNVEEQGTAAGLFGYKNVCRFVTPQGLTDGLGTARDCTEPSNGSAGVLGVGGTTPLNELGPWDASQDFVPDLDLSDFNVTLDLNWALESFSVRSITAYTDFTNEIGFDFDYSSSPHQRGGFDEAAETFSQEFQLTSDFDGPFQFTSGLYYADEESTFAFWILDHTAEVTNRPIVTLPDGTQLPQLTGTPIASTDTSFGGFFGDIGVTDTTALGVYTQGEYSFSDEFRLIAGIRYSDEEKDTRGGSNFTANGPVSVLVPSGPTSLPVPTVAGDVFGYNINAPGTIVGSDSWDNVDWRLGFEWDVSDDAMLYFTAGTGFLSGASNPTNGSFTDQQESEIFEVGIKSTLLDGTLLFNAAAHLTDYSNLVAQFQTVTPVGGTVTRTTNGGEIDAQGIEIETVWVPTENLQLGLNVSILDSEYGPFGQQYPYQLFNGQPASGFIDVEGETTPWSPDYTFLLSAAYDFDLGANGVLTPSLMHFNSDGYNTSNLWGVDPNHAQDNFTKTDLRLTWNSVDGKYFVMAFIENIEDEAVLARGNNGSVDNVQTGFLFPRNWGIRFRMNWE
ncbi:MAG: TonB-dependent receptor [Pseudomonadota bacterium]